MSLPYIPSAWEGIASAVFCFIFRGILIGHPDIMQQDLLLPETLRVSNSFNRLESHKNSSQIFAIYSSLSSFEVSEDFSIPA
jgi:hypothetical protein